jgi:hypothetical protein
MAEIVNLRMARKRAARAAREIQAEQNRARSSAPKAERKLGRARRESELARHEAHRIEPPKR